MKLGIIGGSRSPQQEMQGFRTNGYRRLRKWAAVAAILGFACVVYATAVHWARHNAMARLRATAATGCWNEFCSELRDKAWLANEDILDQIADVLQVYGTSASADEKISIAHRLGEYPSSNGRISVFLGAFSNDSDVRVREQACQALWKTLIFSKCNRSETIHPLLKFLEDREESVRQWAVEGLVTHVSYSPTESSFDKLRAFLARCSQKDAGEIAGQLIFHFKWRYEKLRPIVRAIGIQLERSANNMGSGPEDALTILELIEKMGTTAEGARPAVEFACTSRNPRVRKKAETILLGLSRDDLDGK